MGPLEGVISMYAPAALSYLGQREANQANVDLANQTTSANMDEAARNREFQASQARQQMDFQERMSSTAYQRSVEDLKKAGLNPILAAHNSGASTPSGASGSGSAGSAAQASVENALEGLSASAKEALQFSLQIKKQNADLALMDSQKRNTDADTNLKRVESTVRSKDVPQAEIKNDMYDIVRPYLKKLKESLGHESKSQRNDRMRNDYKNILKGGLR